VVETRAQAEQKHSEDRERGHESNGAGGGFGDVSDNEDRIRLLSEVGARP